MHIEELRGYCLQKKGVSESFPFNETTLVFKVLNKMFALTDLKSEILQINLKCDPEKSIVLRETFYKNIKPGFHMNKKHWNTVTINSEISPEFVLKLLDHSYDLVVSKMTKKERNLLNAIK